MIVISQLRESDNVCGKILKLIDCLNQIKPIPQWHFYTNVEVL